MLKLLRQRVSPYARLIRWQSPQGSHLLWLPCAWSLSMATYALPSVSLLDYGSTLGLFGLGALVMRGAGCTINDLWDSSIDAKVQRTKDRPLASGELKPSQAIIFLGAQLTVGLGILTRLNSFSIALGALSLPLVIAYPLMKRFTYWPQAFLGLTFNWGALLGYGALAGYCDWAVVLPLYAAGIQWTLFYDTIYALQVGFYSFDFIARNAHVSYNDDALSGTENQDKKDDLLVGVKSTAIRFGSSIYKWLLGFAIGTVGCLGLAGYMNGQSGLYYAGLIGASAHFGTQSKLVKSSRVVKYAGRIFKSNVALGWIVFSGLLADVLCSRYFGPSVEEKGPEGKDKDLKRIK